MQITAIMKSFSRHLVLPILVCCCLAGRAQHPDLILTNGKIYTSDTSRRFVQAIAIRGQRIQAMGTSAAIQKLAGPSTRIITLNGRLVIPGINDAHDHVGYGAPVSRFIAFSEPLLPGPGLAQVLDSLKAAVQQVPEGTVIQAHIGLRMLEDSAARRFALDKVAPDHPVILNVPWGHGTIINTRAMQLLGISETEPDPVGGAYERRPGSKTVTGRLWEYAEFGLFRKWHGMLPEAVMVNVFRQYCSQAIQAGITTVQNMATSLDLDKTVAVLEQVNSPLRVRVIRFPGSKPAGRDLNGWTRIYPTTSILKVSGMKWILDGTPLERGALMKTGYSDMPGWRGRLNLPADTVYRLIAEGAASREQLLLHLVGDETPGLVLDGMQRSLPAAAWKQKRLRFEHADGLLPDQYARAARFGVVAVVNPSHFMFADVNHARVGEERSRHYQPFRSLLKAGIPVAIGSDGPNNPFLNIFFATIHPTNPSEAVSVEQALLAYTRGSAYAESAEKEKGMLKPGMLADLAVLSQDIFSIPPPELPKTVSLLTVIGGKIAYDAGVLEKK